MDPPEVLPLPFLLCYPVAKVFLKNNTPCLILWCGGVGWVMGGLGWGTHYGKGSVCSVNVLRKVIKRYWFFLLQGLNQGLIVSAPKTDLPKANDVLAKLKEDPLFLIKKREVENRKTLLANPVKLRKMKVWSVVKIRSNLVFSQYLFKTCVS